MAEGEKRNSPVYSPVPAVTHQMFHSVGPYSPAWVAIGLAEYVDNLYLRTLRFDEATAKSRLKDFARKLEEMSEQIRSAYAASGIQL